MKGFGADNDGPLISSLTGDTLMTTVGGGECGRAPNPDFLLLKVVL